ncbi:MAG: cell division protein ZapA [Ignavibacteriae bacterium]|jgi:cell division protein ZapA|nr:cell division protein ZapA [Ignavibacteriota bacterium]NOG99117.1 cell division protein ZapA [Ignavibacteriota bacterium]
MSEKKKLKVTIFNKEYSLLVENEEVASDLAKYVDKVMDDTQKEIPDQDSETLAIIAALNIAYDLFVEKNKFKEFSIQASDRIKKIKLQINNSESVPHSS